MSGGEKTKDRKQIPHSLYPFSLLYTRIELKSDYSGFGCHSQVITQFVLPFHYVSFKFGCFFLYEILKKVLKGNLRCSQSKLGLTEAQASTLSQVCEVFVPSLVKIQLSALYARTDRRRVLPTAFIPTSLPLLQRWDHGFTSTHQSLYLSPDYSHHFKSVKMH